MTSSRRLVHAAAISLGAFLLFSVEPLVAKQILPWFGGSAGVWSTCLVFFQTALLAGYAYASLISRRLKPRTQAMVHIAVLAASLLLLPVGPGNRWKLSNPGDPSFLILGMLTATIGLPFIALSATSPLLQNWLARTGDRSPYRMFAVSNGASLLALIAYPLLIDSHLDIAAQRLSWSVLYGLFAVLCSLTAWWSRGTKLEAPVRAGGVSGWLPARWFALSAASSMLLLSITNHIDENVAAVPLLWILPLTVYLLTFILSFGTPRLYNQALWMRLLALALGVLGYATYNIGAVEAIQVIVPILLAGLFAGCMFCHAELNRTRPPVEDLTWFYVIIAAGGAAGALIVGLVAPRIFSGIYELPLTLTLLAFLALLTFWNGRDWATRILWVGVTLGMAAVTTINFTTYHRDVLSLRRSFYGSLRVIQTPLAGPQQERILFHGIIKHGSQYVLLPGRREPTTYYGPDSGIGILLRQCYAPPRRIAVVGLGTGTIAAYAQPQDSLKFYEINSQIEDMAESLFFYLRECRAPVKIETGDARLSLERETEPAFDVIVLDAFSGDAIPVHLLTRQAFAVYLRHLKAEGTLAFHVSNNYLDLAPVVGQLASEAGLQAVLVHNRANEDNDTLAADWVLVTNNQAVLESEAVRVHAQPIAKRTGLRPWTDGYSSLLQVFKTMPRR